MTLSTATKKALVFDASGQDGSYLCRNLIDLGYEVHVTTRGHADPVANLQRMDIHDRQNYMLSTRETPINAKT